MQVDVIVSHKDDSKGVQVTIDLNQFMDSPTGESDLGRILMFMSDYLPKNCGPQDEGKKFDVPIE